MNLPRFHLHVIFIATFCVLSGCKPATAPPVTREDQTSGGPALQTSGGARRPPSTVELASFVRGKSPPSLRLVEIKNDPPAPVPGTAPGSNVWSINVRLTFAPTEDVLGSPPPPVVEAFQATVDELTYLSAWGQAYARSPYVSLYPGFSVDPPTPANPQLLRIIQPKDRPFAAVYGKLAAEWQVDHWQYEFIDLALPADNGQFRSAYTGPIMVQGDPATERFVAATRAAIALAKPKKEAIERAYRDDLLKATAPGTLYRGQMSYRGKTMPAEVRFTAPPGGDPGRAEFELRLPLSGYVYTCSAMLAKGVPNMPVPAARTDDAVFRMVEPEPVGDLTVNYESVKNPPKFNLADDLANEFLYARHEVKNVPVTLRNHQLQGKMALFAPPLPGIVLSAQQKPMTTLPRRKKVRWIIFLGEGTGGKIGIGATMPLSPSSVDVCA